MMTKYQRISDWDSKIDRRGFTLIEIMVSLALSAILILAVFGAMHWQWKLRMAGETQVEQSQVVRGVVADLTADLRTVRAILPFERTEATTPHHGSLWQKPTAIRSSDVSEQLLNVARSVPRTPLRFVGESNFLVFETSQPNTRFHPHERTEASNEPQQVLWFCSHGESLRFPVAREQERLLRRSISCGEHPIGMTRVEFSGDERIQWASDSLMPDKHHWFAIANEVDSLRFRFFDSREWHNSWDSHTCHRLPSAVEITFSISDNSRTIVIRLPQGA